MVITPAQCVSLVLFCVSCHCCILDMNFFLQPTWLKVKARIPLFESRGSSKGGDTVRNVYIRIKSFSRKGIYVIFQVPIKSKCGSNLSCQ